MVQNPYMRWVDVFGERKEASLAFPQTPYTPTVFVLLGRKETPYFFFTKMANFCEATSEETERLLERGQYRIADLFGLREKA